MRGKVGKEISKKEMDKRYDQKNGHNDWSMLIRSSIWSERMVTMIVPYLLDLLYDQKSLIMIHPYLLDLLYDPKEWSPWHAGGHCLCVLNAFGQFSSSATKF